MAFVDWRESYSVGLPDIDRQHKQLIAIINQLHDAMRTGAAHAQVVRVVEELARYTREHFAFEERMMMSAKYSGFPEHSRKHRAMIAQVVAFSEKVRNERASTPLKLMEFLKGWLSNHILSTDMDYRSSVHDAARGNSTVHNSSGVHAVR